MATKKAFTEEDKCESIEGFVKLKKHRDKEMQKDEGDDLKERIEGNEFSKEAVTSGISNSTSVDNRTYYSLLLSVTALSIITRLYNIDKPSHVW